MYVAPELGAAIAAAASLTRSASHSRSHLVVA